MSETRELLIEIGKRLAGERLVNSVQRDIDQRVEFQDGVVKFSGLLTAAGEQHKQEEVVWRLHRIGVSP